MKINKRLFWRTLMVLGILESVVLLTGCGNWESQAIQIIQLLNPAIVAVLNILAALGVSVSPSFLTAFQNWSEQAQSALQEVQSLISQYQASSATDQPGILNKVQTVLATFVANLQTILPKLHIDSATDQARIAAALNAIIGFVTAIQNLLPAAAAAKTRENAVNLHARANESVRVFKQEFNTAVQSYGVEYELR